MASKTIASPSWATKAFGVTVGIDPYLTASQTVVLPLHYSHHISGEGGIRTHGAFTLGGFQDLCTKPLYDLSIVTTAGLEPTQTPSKGVMLTITSCGKEKKSENF